MSWVTIFFHGRRCQYLLPHCRFHQVWASCAGVACSGATLDSRRPYASSGGFHRRLDGRCHRRLDRGLDGRCHRRLDRGCHRTFDGRCHWRFDGRCHWTFDGWCRWTSYWTSYWRRDRSSSTSRPIRLERASHYEFTRTFQIP